MAQGAFFLWRNISAKRLFWFKTFWRGSAKVSVSEPARTLLDLLTMPESGGGIDHIECLVNYLRTKDVVRDPLIRLIRYADQFDNDAVLKRLGFVADTCLHDHMLVQACRQLPYNRFAQLDPNRPGSTLATAWRVWVPALWRPADNRSIASFISVSRARRPPKPTTGTELPRLLNSACARFGYG
jgi:predicted transcriptional regulator of viral defense system